MVRIWTLVVVLLLTAAHLLVVATASAAPPTIKPKEKWPDDRGQHVQAHGGGVTKIDDTYYWFGEDRTWALDPYLRYVSCYASKDLAHWTFRNQVLKLPEPEVFGRGYVLERPKVFYNEKTRKYVMYMHVDDINHSLGVVGVATCDTVDGNYRFIKSFRPLNQLIGDIGQFIDDDGAAYLIYTEFWGFRISRLSEDYLTVEKEVGRIKAPLECGSLVRYKDLYYFVGSGLVGGWSTRRASGPPQLPRFAGKATPLPTNPTANMYATATTLTGPWSDFQDICPVDPKTYGAQCNTLLKVVGTKATTVIFMADVWNWKPQALPDSRYLWMPLEIGDGLLRLPEPKDWTLDVETGEAVIRK